MYESMITHLEGMIVSGKYQSGDRIPSLRELGRDFNITVGAVRRGIEILETRGLIESHHGSGIYVAEGRKVSGQERNSCRKIAVFLETDQFENSYCAQALAGAQQFAAENNCSLQLNFCSLAAADESFVQDRITGCHAMLFLGCYDLPLRRIPATLPGVGLSMHESYDGILSTVELDPFRAAELACRFFAAQGCRRVKVVSHEIPVHRARGRIFLQQWAEYGEAAVVHLRDYVAADCSDDSYGYYFVSGTDYNIAAELFANGGSRELAHERMVLSVDGKSLIVPGYHPVNTIYLDWKSAGRIAAAECLRRLEQPGSGAQRIYLNCQLKEIGHFRKVAVPPMETAMLRG